MDSIEKKVYDRYRKRLSSIIKKKYKKISTEEARSKKIYFSSKDNINQKVKELSAQIYQTYLPIIEKEIDVELSEFLKSDKFTESVKNERNLSKKKLTFKSLKKYQDFKINIDNNFLQVLYDEVNDDTDNLISKEELKYITLLIVYKIIDYIRNGYCVKISTILNIWTEQRDMRLNLPGIKKRLIEDRIIPKIKLCKSFGYKLFTTINKDNKAIINYYQAKMDRFLMLLKVKQGVSQDEKN